MYLNEYVYIDYIDVSICILREEDVIVDILFIDVD